MAVNRGIAPPDYSSEVGEVRAHIGDVNYEPFDPDEPGFGVYEMYSDDELEVFLERADSVEGAVASAYLQMAGAAAREAKMVKDYDLQVDLVKRADALRRMAELWISKSEAGYSDFFEAVDTVVDRVYRVPELSARPFRGC